MDNIRVVCVSLYSWSKAIYTIDGFELEQQFRVRLSIGCDSAVAGLQAGSSCAALQ